MSNPISRAIDTNLSSLRVTDRDVTAIMDRIREEEQPRARKLKLRYAIVLALLAALLTAGGTAAVLLSPREIISDEVLPMAESSDSGLWLTEEQVVKVLDMARNNDIDLSEATQSSIYEALREYHGYWTERLIWDLMSARYGAMGDWPQEEVDWYRQTIASLETAYAEGRERDPAEGELTRDQAIERAKTMLWATYPTVPLSDPAKYDVVTEFQDGLSGGYYPGYYWYVHFDRKDAFVPDIWVDISADGSQLYDFACLPGAGPDAKGDEIWTAFSDVYGNQSAWSQETWRAFVDNLKLSKANGMNQWDYFDFIIRTDYPDIVPEAMPIEKAEAIALEALGLTAGDEVSISGTVYLGDDPNPVWKVTVYESRDLAGYEDSLAHFVEVDSVTGEVKAADSSMWVFAYRYRYALHSVYKSTIPDIPKEAYPSVTAEQAIMSAMSYIQTHFDETRDLNNAEVFDIEAKEELRWQFTMNTEWLVTFDAKAFGEVGYWAWVDGFGEVMDAGVDNGAVSLGRSLDSIRQAAGLTGGELFYGSAVRDVTQKVESVSIDSDPLVGLFRNTEYDGEPGDAERSAAYRALGVKEAYIDDADCAHESSIRIAVCDANGQPTRYVDKFALRTDKGNFLLELDDSTHEIVSLVRVKSFSDPWYAAFLLESDMEAAGLAPEPYTPPVNNGQAVDDGCVTGLWLRHIYRRYLSLYDAGPLGWSQAQLQAFQVAVSQSTSLGDDLGAVCVQHTRYPDVPENAITPEAAAEAGAKALSLTDYEVEGAVLIADQDGPVWKVTYRSGTVWQFAEVDCMTGEVRTTAEDRGAYNWYQEIVLERTIQEHQESFHSIGNG